MHKEMNQEEAVVTQETPVEEQAAPQESGAEAVATPAAASIAARFKHVNVKFAMVVAAVVILLAVLYAGRGLVVAATVNGAPIGRMSVTSELEKTSGKQMLESLITKKLIQQAAADAGITVPAETIAAEIKKLEDQVNAGGSGSLDELLAQQGMTRKDLEEQLVLQKQVELILGEKVAVTDAEIDEYITKNKLSIPKEQLAAARTEIGDQLKQQKMSIEGQQFVGGLREKASISYFVHY